MWFWLDYFEIISISWSNIIINCNRDTTIKDESLISLKPVTCYNYKANTAKNEKIPNHIARLVNFGISEWN